MTDVNSALERARALLATEPLPGAQQRVLAAVLARDKAPRPRRARALVLAVAVVLTTSAGALALVEAPRLGRALALVRHAGSWATPNTSAVGARKARPEAKPAVPASSAGPQWGPPSVASVNPTPELPHAPAASSSVHANANASAAHDAPSSLAEEVAAYREAEALVGDSPGLAVARLNAFRHRYPASPLVEEASLRLIQALLALGRDDEARRQARHFVQLYPTSAKRAELERFANGEQ